MNEWKRQHPAAIFISFLSNLKQMIITLIAVFIFGQSSQAASPIFYLLFFAAILLFSVGNGFISWWKFHYFLKEDELQIKQGLIFRKNRFIRKDRIQSIDINAKLIQRMFGLVEVRIETAGGGSEPEFRIVALKKQEALAIKKHLLTKYERPTVHATELDEDEGFLAEQGETNSTLNPLNDELKADTANDSVNAEGIEEVEFDEEDTPPDFEWALGSKRLIIAALTSSGVGIAATFIAAIVSQAPQFLPEWLFDQLIGWFIHSSILVLGGMLVSILFAAWLFTLIGTILKYGYFTLTKRENDIHISRGVLEQRQLTLNAKRITAVRIVQTPIRQMFNYVSIYVESAGGGTKEEDLSTILTPLCKRKEIQGILDEIVPEFSFIPEYEGLPKESLRRYMIKLIVPSLIIAGVATYFIPYGWIAFLLPALGGGLGYIQYRSAGISQVEDFLCIKSRVIAKTEVFLPKRRIQDVESSQNVLQKLDNLYTIHVAVLTSMVGKTFSLRHISGEQIERGYLWYSYEQRLREQTKKTSADHEES
ncbi:PH domain-containing protein [Salipaludibacillus daqingensis]|uniref:PH domain-containing protein n=1 Tax=Salipaludibacillus daqingensis TaxID=3041001 RepID=UPI002474DCC6|nr:PH domain-containing protein [Salipaludibacillus daqingensis]